MKEKKLGVNAFLNAFRSGLSIIFPLITYPYIFRILHADGIGKVNYSMSIVNYFTLLAGLGISTYATREGAKIRKNQRDLGVFVNQVFTINVLSTCLAYILLTVCLMLIPALKPYRELIIILSTAIGFTTLGIDWINTIFEDYAYIAARSVVINLLSLIMLFVFVRDEKDVFVYAFLTVVTNASICILNWIYCRKYVKIRLTWKINFIKHIKPTLILFANAVATNIYVNIGVTMLGWIKGDYAVGIYELAAKIYAVVKRLLASIYTVAIPRISFHIGRNDYEQVRKIYTGMFSWMTLLLFPASTGLLVLSEEVVLIMGGIEYIEAVRTLQIMCVGLLGAIFGGLFGYCLLIPLGKENNIVRATMVSAVVNIVLNALLIPKFGANGAAISTVVSEFVVVICHLVTFKDINKYLDVKIWLRDAIHSCVGCVSIVLIARLVQKMNLGILANLALIFGISLPVYIIELIILKNDKATNIFYKIIHK